MSSPSHGESSRVGRGGGQIVPRPDGWRSGSPAPWGSRPYGSSLDVVTVVGAVAARPSTPEDDLPVPPGVRPSAVLVALHDGPQGAEVVLTRRSWALTNHRGEVSFPGGRLEPGETPEAGALREAHEEVALDPGAVALVGRLPALSTVVSMSHIVPVVGRLDHRPALRPATDEVDRILHVPLVALTAPEVFREERWGEPPLERAISFFDLEDETIWGATAHILVDLLTIVLDSSTRWAG